MLGGSPWALIVLDLIGGGGTCRSLDLRRRAADGSACARGRGPEAGARHKFLARVNQNRPPREFPVGATSNMMTSTAVAISVTKIAITKPRGNAAAAQRIANATTEISTIACSHRPFPP